MIDPYLFYALIAAIILLWWLVGRRERG